MSNPTPIETLLARVITYRSGSWNEARELDSLLEAFREVLGALKKVADARRRTVFDVLPGDQPPRMVLMIEYDNELATEALARANEIASQALGETKS